MFLDNNLILVNIIPVGGCTSPESIICFAQIGEVESDLLHCQSVHLRNQYLQMMCKEGCVLGSEVGDKVKTYCDVFARSTETTVLNLESTPRATWFLENVHVDLCGRIRTKGLNCTMYFVIFCIKYSSFRHICPLNDKTE